jgi:hypothetical protein
MNHTPGPWEVFFVNNSTVVVHATDPDVDQPWQDADTLVATAHNEPNARLIAAAPDLLLALRALMVTLQNGDVPTMGLFINADAAIAKAEGRE